MRIFVRGVVSGFAFSLGAALFKKVSSKLGLDDKTQSDAAKSAAQPPIDGKDAERAQPNLTREESRG